MTAIKLMGVFIIVISGITAMAELNIIDASYGQGDNSVQVTYKVKPVELRTNFFAITATNALVDKDPAYRKKKVLTLKYNDNGTERTAIIRENTTGYILIGAKSSKDFTLCGAYYGAGKEWHDVTEKIVEIMGDGTVVNVSDDLFGKGFNPQTRKTLVVFYSANDEIKDMIIQDGGKLFPLAIKKTISVSATVPEKPNDKKPNVSAAQKSSKLTDLEDQLDEVEKKFWLAASLTKNDPFVNELERQITTLILLSRDIQAMLVEQHRNSNSTNMPKQTLRLQSVWQKFAGKGPYNYRKLRCSSRRCYGASKTPNKSKADYLQWLENTMVSNIMNFNVQDDNAISARVSDFYMAVKELRVSIVNLAELDLFEENPMLSIPDNNGVISGRFTQQARKSR